MRMLLISLASVGLAAAAASAQVDDYTCRKTKDLKQPQFAGSTAANVADEFSIHSEDGRKPFLYCAPTTPDSELPIVPLTNLTCYKVRSSETTGDAGPAQESAPRKTYVLCVPATPSDSSPVSVSANGGG